MLNKLRAFCATRQKMPVTQNFVIVIDGLAGVGKTTVARLLALMLGAIHLKVGEAFRAFALKAREENIDPADDAAIAALIKRTAIDFVLDKHGATVVMVDGRPLGPESREEEISALASKLGKNPVLNEYLIKFQREFASRHNVVVDSRNGGTEAFPDCPAKFWLTAHILVRASRRFAELSKLAAEQRVQFTMNVHDVAASMQARDRQDQQREVAPARMAGDAIQVSTSDMTAEETVSVLLGLLARNTKVDAELRHKALGMTTAKV